MEVRCDQCQARYRVDDARVGPKGLAMRCGKCGNTFRLARDGTVTKTAGANPSSIPTPGAATPLATRPSPAFQPAAQSQPEPGAKPLVAETPSALPVAAPPARTPAPAPIP